LGDENTIREFVSVKMVLVFACVQIQ